MDRYGRDLPNRHVWYSNSVGEGDHEYLVSMDFDK